MAGQDIADETLTAFLPRPTLELATMMVLPKKISVWGKAAYGRARTPMLMISQVCWSFKWAVGERHGSGPKALQWLFISNAHELL